MGILVEKTSETSKWKILFIGAAFGGWKILDILNTEIMVSKGKIENEQNTNGLQLLEEFNKFVADMEKKYPKP